MSFNTNLYPESILNELKRRLRTKSHKNPSIPKFIFVCGRGFNNDDNDSIQSNNREEIRRFYSIYNDVHVLFAEELWLDLNVDLLSFEHFMAQISDCIILFLESYGTACELGAFTTIDTLNPKLIVYVDKKYRQKNSFINRGPLEKIRLIDDRNVIFGNIESIFESSLFWTYINSFVKLAKKCRPNTDPNKVDFGSYCVEILDIISILGPVHSKEVVNLYKYLKGFDTFYFSIETKIQPGFALKFLKMCSLIQSKEDYIRVNPKLVQQNLMLFRLSNSQLNCFRAKFLARKYKYLGDFKC